MTTPPILRYVEEASRVLYTLYETWRQHHTDCARCGREDWYNPGLPRTVLEDEATTYDRLLATHQVQLWPLAERLPGPSGPWILVIPAPDVAVLCVNGAAFFRQWRFAAMQMPISAIHRERITSGMDPEDGELE